MFSPRAEWKGARLIFESVTWSQEINHFRKDFW